MELKLGYYGPTQTPTALLVETGEFFSESTLGWVRGTHRLFTQAVFNTPTVHSIKLDDGQPILDLLKGQKPARYVGETQGGKNFLWQGGILTVKGIEFAGTCPIEFLTLLNTLSKYDPDLSGDPSRV